MGDSGRGIVGGIIKIARKEFDLRRGGQAIGSAGRLHRDPAVLEMADVVDEQIVVPEYLPSFGGDGAGIVDQLRHLIDPGTRVIWRRQREDHVRIIADERPVAAADPGLAIVIGVGQSGRDDVDVLCWPQRRGIHRGVAHPEPSACGIVGDGWVEDPVGTDVGKGNAFRERAYGYWRAAAATTDKEQGCPERAEP